MRLPRTAWRWLTAPLTIRTRRITFGIWILLILFSNGIQHFLDRYGRVVQRINLSLLAVCLAALAVLLARAWYAGRPARRARREN